MPLKSAITAACVLALSLIMLVCTCLVCRSRRTLCFRGNNYCMTSYYYYHPHYLTAAEKDVTSVPNPYSQKAESKVSLVNETLDKTDSPPTINPHSTKV